MMQRIIPVFLVFLLGLSGEIDAQDKRLSLDTASYLEQPDRIEFSIENSDLDFTIVNGGMDGMMLVKETNVRNNLGYGWVLYKLDTALHIEWTKLLIVPYSYSFKGFEYSRGKYFLLFSRVQFNSNEFSIFEIDANEGQYAEIEISTVFPIILSHFEVINKTVLLAGSVNYKPAILTFELSDPKPRVIPGIYNDNAELLDVYVDDDLGIFNVALLERTYERRYTVNIKTYSTENILIQNNIVHPGVKRSVIDGAPTHFADGFQYVAGAYSNKSPDYSRGLYLAKFINGNQQFIKYYNYAELTDFFGYMGSKRQQRVYERISKRNEKGKMNRFSYRLLVHDIIERDNKFLLIAEAYYPRYTNYYDNSFGVTRTGYSSISGYKFTHSIVVAFDKTGDILWDHSFKIDDVMKLNLTKTVQVVPTNDHIELHYLEENTIRTKVIKGDKVLDVKSNTPVRLNSENEEFVIKDPEVEDLDIWYENVLYAFGQQQIDLKFNNSFKARRKVFYINKVFYNPNN